MVRLACQLGQKAAAILPFTSGDLRPLLRFTSAHCNRVEALTH